MEDSDLQSYPHVLSLCVHLSKNSRVTAENKLFAQTHRE